MSWASLVTAPIGAGLLVISSLSGATAASPADAQAPTSVSVDVIPSGNTATSVDSIQTCAAAEEGDAFIVDIVIQDMEDLLAWELPVTYDPDVLEVTGRDVTQQFQSANPGSQVLDLSDEVPDGDGRYELQAADTGDPPSPDSGSGTLVRLTLTAIGEGVSPLSIAPVDIDGEGGPDRGILLRASGADGLTSIVGDDDGDSIFDGPALDGEIRVGRSCTGADSENVVQTVDGGTDQDTGDDDDTDGGSGAAVVVAATLAAVAAVAVLAFVVLRRRAARS